LGLAGRHSIGNQWRMLSTIEIAKSAVSTRTACMNPVLIICLM